MRELKRIIVGDLGAGGEVASSSAGAQAARILSPSENRRSR